MLRRWTPGVPDVVFALVLSSVLYGGRYQLLNDPGTLWHLRLGREILASGAVPRVDALTFTHAGEPWVDQSWLFDVALAWVVGHGGWSAAALVSALLIASVYAFLTRGLLRDGYTPLVVLCVALTAAGVGTIHFLIRPHLVTLALVGLTLRVCRLQHENGGRRVFVLPFVVAVWANLHGGFLAGPLIVFTAAVGHAVSGPWESDRRREVAKFAAAGLLGLLGAAANPYGFELYRHVGRLLVSSGVTDLIKEYQPIPFGRPDARAFECLLLGLVVLPTVSVGRMTRYELAHTVVWLHLSLTSVRHAPLFALAVAPGLARLLGGVSAALQGDADPSADECSRRSVWPALAAVGLSLAVFAGTTLCGFDPAHWPLAALPELDRLPTDARLFHEQDWGGMVEGVCRPPRKAFIDDRFELHGREGILDYLDAVEGGPDWDLIRDRSPIALVWVRPGRGLARRLANDPGWRVVHRDSVSVLFRRTENSPARAVDLTSQASRP